MAAQTSLEVAVTFLQGFLRDGKRSASDVKTSAQQVGIAPRTLRCARELLRVHYYRRSYRNRGQGCWEWRLPENALVGQVAPLSPLERDLLRVREVVGHGEIHRFHVLTFESWLGDGHKPVMDYSKRVHLRRDFDDGLLARGVVKGYPGDVVVKLLECPEGSQP